MIFSLIILLMVGGIAFFHYVQGLFSATLSAILTVIAAVFAISYHEQVVAMLMKGNMADSAHAITLVAMFAAIYLILRIIFDKSIPGNVRFPLIVDKVGAGVMGVVAGIFATGVFAIAAQMLPFGPSIAQYSRFETADRDPVTIPAQAVANGRAKDSATFSELNQMEDPLNPEKAKSLLIPSDDLVIAMVNKLSDGGSLAGDRPLASIHPSWLNQLFASRLGIQPGTKTVTINIPGRQELKDVEAVFSLPQVDEIDAEFSQIRGPFIQVKKKGGDVLKPNPDQVLLGIRCNFDINATDEDKMIRFSTGAIRLLGVSGDEGSRTYIDYHPLGTMDGKTLYRNRPDDPIIANLTTEGVIDFLFLVNAKDVFKNSDPKAGIKPGVFFEAKRLARIDLAGKEVGGLPDSDRKSQVLRKELEKAGEGKTGGRDSNAPVAKDAPLTVRTVVMSDQIFSAINAGSASDDKETTITSGSVMVKNKKFKRVKIDGSESLARMGAGDFAYKDLFIPEGKRIVQVQCVPTGGDPWKWSEDFNKWEVVDGAGRKYKPNGAFAKISADRTQKMVAQYDADNQIDGIPHPESGTPSDVWLAFVVPQGENIKDVLYDGKSLKRVNVEMK